MRKRKVKRVDLVFENCESVRLDPSMFHGLWIGGVTKDYAVNCYQYKAGEMSVYIVCSHLGVTVNEKGLSVKTLPDLAFSRALRDRLKSRDITHVNLVFGDGTEEYIGVPCRENVGAGGNFTNEFQKHKWEKKRTQVEIKIQATKS